MKHLLKCPGCNAYTMKEHCPNCSAKALSPKPPKYSPEDKYGHYRRIVKEEERKKLA